MSEQIGVGDKVMLVWACCPVQRQNIGFVSVVRLIVSDVEGTCPGCDSTFDATTVAVLDGLDPGSGFPVSWLKKMPPDGEQVDERETQEIGA